MPPKGARKRAPANQQGSSANQDGNPAAPQPIPGNPLANPVVPGSVARSGRTTRAGGARAGVPAATAATTAANVVPVVSVNGLGIQAFGLR
jgi:hypothetical protein